MIYGTNWIINRNTNFAEIVRFVVLPPIQDPIPLGLEDYTNKIFILYGLIIGGVFLVKNWEKDTLSMWLSPCVVLIGNEYWIVIIDHLHRDGRFLEVLFGGNTAG